MNTKNNYIRDYLGVTLWHELGYTGTRTAIGSAEDFTTASTGDHAYKTYAIAKEIAPDAKYHFFRVGQTKVGQTIADRQKILSDKIAETSVTVYFASLSGARDARFDECAKAIPDVTFMYAAGNEGTEESSGYIKCESIYGVGAVILKWSSTSGGVPTANAKLLITPATYSSVSEHVDFSAPTEVYLSNNRKFTGTSCATPVLAGMCALVNDFFIEKTGAPLSREKMYQFMKDHSVDLKTEGHDTKTGWGIPVLPDPRSIDVAKYQDKELIDVTYKDDAKINPVHKNDVYRAYDLGIMNGSNGFFDPKEPLTREQMASVAVRIYDALTKAVDKK